MQANMNYSSRHAIDPQAASAMATGELRRHFHIADLFQPGWISLTYTHYDRMIVGAQCRQGGVGTGGNQADRNKKLLDRPNCRGQCGRRWYRGCRRHGL